jgi:hypothetical protein
MGVFSTSAWVQINSTLARGWYQFGVPDGIFASGRSAALHLNGAVNMAPLPLEIELTKTNNQQYASSTVFLALTSTSPANIVQIVGQPAVTSGAGILTVSTQTLAAGSGDITSIYGAPIVTSGAGTLSVSTQTIDKTGYFTAGTSFANLIQIYAQPAVTSGAGILTVSTQTLAAGSGDIISIYGQPVVTSAAGILNVSTQTLTVPDNVGIASISSAVIDPMAESYRANGAQGTMAQLMYEMISHMGEASISGTTKTISQLVHTTAAMSFQLDSSSAPSSVTRIT